MPIRSFCQPEREPSISPPRGPRGLERPVAILLLALVLFSVPVVLMILGPRWYRDIAHLPRGHERLLHGVLLDRPDDVHLALREGAAVDTPSLAGYMPLTIAADASSPVIVQALVAAGADLDHLCPRGTTALTAAVQRNRPEVVQILLDAGANPNQHRPGHQTPLCLAALYGNDQIARMLLSAGADPRLPGLYGETPEVQAASAGQLRILSLLHDQDHPPVGEPENLSLADQSP